VATNESRMSLVAVTCVECGQTEMLEAHPCVRHGEPAHKCELLCPECVNVTIAWSYMRGLSIADMRHELGLTNPGEAK
jgi:ribosomal protein S27E